MLQFAVRFAVGGAVVAAIPLIADRFGARVAGTVALVPAVAVVGLVAVYLQDGREAFAAGALGALWSLVALGGFLAAVWFAASRTAAPVWVVIAAAYALWAAVAFALVAGR